MQILKASSHYKIDKLVGEGLNSRVYKAFRHDQRTGLRHCVALKRLKSKQLVQLWKAEFKTLSQVRSLFCVRVLDFVWLQNQPTLVLEYVDGPSLDRLYPSLSKACIYEVLRQVQLGLEDLRQHQLCHGDLSLHNIMINSKGQVRLIDFGLANSKFKQLTPEFAAPEVLKGNEANSQSDMYSVGRVAQRLLGRLSKVQKNAWLHPFPKKRTWVDASSIKVGGVKPEALKSEKHKLSEKPKRPKNRALSENRTFSEKHKWVESPLAQSTLQRAVYQWNAQQNSRTRTLSALGLGLQNRIRLNDGRIATWVRFLVLGLQNRIQLNWRLVTSQLRMALVWSVMLMCLGVMGVAPRPQMALLQIQGIKWKHIDIDGRDLGYSPLNLEVRPYVTYRVGITSQTGHVYKRIRLHPDEVYVISDE